jgi:hypothetical protein
MFPYWILFSIFAAGSLQYRRRLALGQEGNPLLIAAGLFTALMIGLRYEVGGDWGSYSRIFEQIRYLSMSGALGFSDPGYGFLNWLSHELGFDLWFVNLVCGAIFSWGLVKFARTQPNPWLAVLVAVPYLIIVVAMGYTRQGVAIGFILAGLAALDRISMMRFALYVFCAVLFHKSAIIVLPLVALSASRNRIVTILLLILLMACLYYVFVAASIDRMVTNYVEAEYESQGAAVRVAMNLPPAILFLRFQNRFELGEAQKKLWRNFALAALATLIALWTVASSTAVDRLALYLIPLQIFVLARLPVVFRGQGQSNGQITLGVIVYSAVIQFVWLSYANNAVYWLPYQLYPLFWTPSDAL